MDSWPRVSRAPGRHLHVPVARVAQGSSMSREKILAAIRQSLKRREPLDANVERALAARDGSMAPHVQPRYDGSIVDRLLDKHATLMGSAARVGHATEIVNEIVAYLRDRNLPESIVAADREPLRSLPWGDGLKCEFRPAKGADRVCVSVADAAIAETGTVVLVSSPGTPMSHAYLPEHHIVVVETRCVVKWQEDVWRVLRTRPDFPPRGIAMVSGPSKTADVEQTIEYGAHGPRNVHLIVLNAQAQA
ncbi:MAG: lactate utilization protein C [Proteobacteria bacterium]|nr:MAG: lactate utilization protein C [Pseudomonadota bacterium]